GAGRGAGPISTQLSPLLGDQIWRAAGLAEAGVRRADAEASGPARGGAREGRRDARRIRGGPARGSWWRRWRPRARVGDRQGAAVARSSGSEERGIDLLEAMAPPGVEAGRVARHSTPCVDLSSSGGRMRGRGLGAGGGPEPRCGRRRGGPKWPRRTEVATAAVRDEVASHGGLAFRRRHGTLEVKNGLCGWHLAESGTRSLSLLSVTAAASASHPRWSTTCLAETTFFWMALRGIG
ncbi:unnamed protein product, partial [Urochloa humidicola]